jgi:hypothetical protein
MSRISLAIWPCAALVWAGCVQKDARTNIDPAYVQANLLAEAPPIANPVNANLGGKVVYLGNQVDRKVLRPGDQVRIVHFWKVVANPGAGWRVFTHVLGDRGSDWLNVDYSDMRTGHPPDKWQAGQVIRDEQTITVRKDWASAEARIVVGLWRRGGPNGGRMAIAAGPGDNESRVPALRLAVVGAGTSQDGPYVVRRAVDLITIDGKAQEQSWLAATPSPVFVSTEGGLELKQRTQARLLWDSTNLYAFIEVADTDVYSEFSTTDGDLWKADVVELFIDADRNGAGYVELQVNPNNAQFDAWFATTRRAGINKEWTAGMTSAVHVRGTADKRDDVDQGWDVEIAIPLSAVKGLDDNMAVAIPPRIGDTWNLNIVRVDKAPDADQIAASSWARIPVQDFHALDRLLPVSFGDANGNAPGAAAAPADTLSTDQPANQPTSTPPI